MSGGGKCIEEGLRLMVVKLLGRPLWPRARLVVFSANTDSGRVVGKKNELSDAECREYTRLNPNQPGRRVNHGMSIEDNQWCIRASRIVEAMDEKGLIVVDVGSAKVIGCNG